MADLNSIQAYLYEPGCEEGQPSKSMLPTVHHPPPPTYEEKLKHDQFLPSAPLSSPKILETLLPQSLVQKLHTQQVSPIVYLSPPLSERDHMPPELAPVAAPVVTPAVQSSLKHLKDIYYSIGIDFGTARSGYAYSRYDSRREWFDQSVNVPIRWSNNCEQPKTSTHLLLRDDADLSFVAFGDDAQFYLDSQDKKSSEKLLFFRHFKMKLFDAFNTPGDIPKIEATNVPGRFVDCITIITRALEYLKKKVLENVKSGDVGGIQESHCLWILTVPAIWSTRAKAIMRTAAHKAKLMVDDDHLILALEPEAAAVTCLEQARVPCANKYFFPGSQYIILDCGGGTIDTVVHELDNNLDARSVLKPTGGPWGSTYIDEAFIGRILTPLLDASHQISGCCSQGVLRRMSLQNYMQEHPSDYTGLLQAFEILKVNVTAAPQQWILNLRKSLVEYPKKKLGLSFGQLVLKYNQRQEYETVQETLCPGVYDQGNKLKMVLGWEEDTGRLIIDHETMLALFHNVLQPISKHIKSDLFSVNSVHPKCVFLLGGFGSSPLLKQIVTHALPKSQNIDVIVSHNGSKAIVNGAVLFGLNPKVIASRRMDYTYGIRAKEPYSQQHERDGRLRQGEKLIDVFTAFVKVGQEVNTDERVERKFFPSHESHQEIDINILRSPYPDPKYPDNDLCSVAGYMKLVLPPLPGGPVPCQERGLIVSFFFGRTEISVEAHDLLTSTKSIITLTYDLLRDA